MLDAIISEHGRDLTCAVGENLFVQGDRSDFVYFVKAGLLKASYLGADGREQIKTILTPGMAIGSMTALTSDGRCSFGVQAVEESIVRAVPYSMLRSAAAEDLSSAQEVIEILADLARRKERREYELLCLSAEERYLLYLKEVAPRAPSLSQMDIAAYLGITPPALSRIRRRHGMTQQPKHE